MAERVGSVAETNDRSPRQVSTRSRIKSDKECENGLFVQKMDVRKRRKKREERKEAHGFENGNEVTPRSPGGCGNNTR